MTDSPPINTLSSQLSQTQLNEQIDSSLSPEVALTSPLLRLPGEIRNQIIQEELTGDPDDPDSFWVAKSLALTCRQLKEEVGPIEKRLFEYAMAHPYTMTEEDWACLTTAFSSCVSAPDHHESHIILKKDRQQAFLRKKWKTLGLSDFISHISRYPHLRIAYSSSDISWGPVHENRSNLTYIAGLLTDFVTHKLSTDSLEILRPCEISCDNFRNQGLQEFLYLTVKPSTKFYEDGYRVLLEPKEIDFGGVCVVVTSPDLEGESTLEDRIQKRFDKLEARQILRAQQTEQQRQE